ncbi:MAG: epoxide hydrolase N-terminal domain-containing protein [Streptosporangiaceae bacterium]
MPGADRRPWQAGTDPDYLRELVTYWHDDFDWRARERELKALPQFTVGIDGQRVHFVHVRAAGSGPARPALPLVLTHGWPSSFLEMLPLTALLTDPGSHGGDPHDAFDVVIPSLPGFVFSGLPVAGPVTPPVIADLRARLMSDVLGYPRFGAPTAATSAHTSPDSSAPAIATASWASTPTTRTCIPCWTAPGPCPPPRRATSPPGRPSTTAATATP